MKFEKVSYDVFKAALGKIPEFAGVEDDDIRRFYDEIKLPERATSGSAGYDFYSPIAFCLMPLSARLEPFEDPFTRVRREVVEIKRNEVLIPTGIKAQIDPDWVLVLAPRSGQGFKYGVALANTVGIIDEDYYNNENNEGHIMVKITTTSTEFPQLCLNRGSAFCQGIFLPYGLTDDDKSTAKRTGGLGSTGV